MVGLVAVVGLMTLGVSAEPEGRSRTKELLCESWQFHLGDQPGAEAPGFDLR